MPDWLAVVILGIVEGLTEFLPVSSTGHLLIAEQWLHPSIAKTALFNIVIQCGALLAVLVVFSRRVTQLAMTVREPDAQRYLMQLGLAFGITGAGGLFVKKVLHWKLPETLLPVAIATVAGGVVILIVEALLKRRSSLTEMTWAAAVAVGVAQLVAGVFPGTSRSGACILFALALGVRRPAATEFSFLVGIPTLFAASALEILEVFKSGAQVSASDWRLIAIGCFTAAVSAFIVVQWLLRYVQTHDFVIFGWYRIILGALLFWQLA